MNTGIQRVQSLSEEIFQREVRFLQNAELAKRKSKENEQNALKNSNEAANIVLKCKGTCGKIVCKASDLRVVNKSHYVNPDPSFQEKVPTERICFMYQNMIFNICSIFLSMTIDKCNLYVKIY